MPCDPRVQLKKVFHRLSLAGPRADAVQDQGLVSCRNPGRSTPWDDRPSSIGHRVLNAHLCTLMSAASVRLAPVR